MLNFAEKLSQRDRRIMRSVLIEGIATFEKYEDNEKVMLEMLQTSLPNSLQCMSPYTIKKTIQELLEAEGKPLVYQLTAYHWMMLYEVLNAYFIMFEDEVAYISEPLRYIYKITPLDFQEFISTYSLDNDCLMVDTTKRLTLNSEQLQLKVMP